MQRSCILHRQTRIVLQSFFGPSVNPDVAGAVALTYDQGCNFNQKLTDVMAAGERL